MRHAFIIPCAVIAACSGNSDSGLSTSSALSGPVDVRVTQRMPPGTQVPIEASMTPERIVVTIARVEAKLEKGESDRGWVTLSVGPRTIDLLALPTGGFASLGVTTLPAGDAEQLRLIVDANAANHVVTTDGVSHPLVVPSGATSGIKVVGDFDVAPCATGALTLVFEGDRGIVVHPATVEDGLAPDTWVLRPVIRVDEVVVSGTCPRADDEGDDGHGHRHR